MKRAFNYKVIAPGRVPHLYQIEAEDSQEAIAILRNMKHAPHAVTVAIENKITVVRAVEKTVEIGPPMLGPPMPVTAAAA